MPSAQDESLLTVALDDRLSAVATLVRGPRVADIGTDHAMLPRYLLEQEIAGHVIAVEKNEAHLALARAALRGYQAEVRRGDGFDALKPGEVDCATLCGLGGRLIAQLLSRHPKRLPPRLVLQANRDTPLLRAWAQQSGYHLKAERMVPGFWNFVILSLIQAEGEDPAYALISQELAHEFGPHLLRERHPLLCDEILKRESHFRGTRAVGVHRLLCSARDFLQV